MTWINDESRNFATKELTSCTESFLRGLAERYGLTVLKRITTGGERSHFATFELAGIRACDAWPAVQDSSHWRLSALRLPDPGFTDNLPYIEVQSVWCETEEAE